MQNQIWTYLKSFISLVYPNYCVLCKESLLQKENTICTVCTSTLNYTNYHLVNNNPVEKKLWGRVPFEKASSLLFFEKGLDTQTLITLLKYKDRQDVGERLAEIFAKQLIKDRSELLKVDLIIPIPLHYKKLKRRGYNQCDKFVEKFSEITKIPFSIKVVERQVDTISQTGKNRIDRWENVSDIFKINDSKTLENKHILLVDDVITTGATIEALAIKILIIENTKISMLFMASAV